MLPSDIVVGLPHCPVEPPLVPELLVGATLHHLAPLQHEDGVRALGPGHRRGYHHPRPPHQGRVQTLLGCFDFLTVDIQIYILATLT